MKLVEPCLPSLLPEMSAIDFSYLASISDNDREFEEELLRVYLEDAQTHLEGARLAIEALDWEKLGKEAHHLKGASGNVGAQSLQSLALTLENAAKKHSIDESRAALDRMVELFQEVKQLFWERYGS